MLIILLYGVSNKKKVVPTIVNISIYSNRLCIWKLKISKTSTRQQASYFLGVISQDIYDLKK